MVVFRIVLNTALPWRHVYDFVFDVNWSVVIHASRLLLNIDTYGCI